jgi:UDP-3-O-[3-hydroxymyristoyl] N-acetylglucosamine deacetylase
LNSERQGTLKEKVGFSGVGIHTGQPATVTVCPAAENSGRRFQVSGVEFPARIDHVLNCDRCTILGKGEATVHTPEHLLAALVALGIDNALIQIDGPEVPVLDGGSLEFCKAFQTIGIQSQDAAPKYLKPDRPYSVRQDNGALVLVLPSDRPVYEYVLYYDHPMIGCQNVEFRPNEDDFATQIAPARTFALWEEVKPLIERGMGQGGHADNCLVIFQDQFSTPLKVENEPVRHKCLDLIGDFGLLDARIQARILAIKAGHALHVGCAKIVWEDIMVAYERA